MAQVTVYADPGIVVDVIAGSPPADQSQEIADLKKQVADLTAANDKLKADNAALQKKIDNAMAALA